jgi:hypothetical protein
VSNPTEPALSNPASLALPSDLEGSSGHARAALTEDGSLRSPGTERELPEVMHVAFHGGETVELLKDQKYADRVVVRAGERGKAISPSSQAASWVVLFSRLGAKTRVVPEWLLKKVD